MPDLEWYLAVFVLLETAVLLYKLLYSSVTMVIPVIFLRGNRIFNFPSFQSLAPDRKVVHPYFFQFGGKAILMYQAHFAS